MNLVLLVNGVTIQIDAVESCADPADFPSSPFVGIEMAKSTVKIQLGKAAPGVRFSNLSYTGTDGVWDSVRLERVEGETAEFEWDFDQSDTEEVHFTCTDEKDGGIMSARPSELSVKVPVVSPPIDTDTDFDSSTLTVISVTPVAEGGPTNPPSPPPPPSSGNGGGEDGGDGGSAPDTGSEGASARFRV